MIGEIALAARLLGDVRVASHLGALLAGEPDLGPKLEHIAWRECRLQACSVHEADARHMERTLGPGMGTRGAWGTVAAFTVKWLPFGLTAPWWLDVPLLGAYAAARRAAHPRCRQVAGCSSWLGVHSPVDRLRSELEQASEQAHRERVQARLRRLPVQQGEDEQADDRDGQGDE